MSQIQLLNEVRPSRHRYLSELGLVADNFSLGVGPRGYELRQRMLLGSSSILRLEAGAGEGRGGGGLWAHLFGQARLIIKQLFPPDSNLDAMEPEQQEERRSKFEELPIGHSNSNAMLDEYPPDFNPNDLNESMKPQPLPLAKRIQSKVWKIRKEALQQLYQEVIEDSQAYKQFEPMTISLITDSNHMCQDRALKILVKFLEAGNALGIETKALIKSILEKCLMVDKGEITSNSTSIMFWAMDHSPQLLLNEVNEALGNKNPKIVACTLSFIESLLHNYGARKLQNLQIFSKQFTLLAAPVRPIAKPQAIELFKEGFKWMGPAVFNLHMHPEVKEEVNKFSKVHEKEPMVIKRGLNEEQKKSKKPIVECQDDEGSDEPQDVLTPYDSRWVDKTLELQKWKEKKAVLDDFIKKIQVKNIVPRESSHFITLIKRLLSENNINLLQCGFKVVKNLCRGLKRHFHHSCKVFLGQAYGKLKDSKAMIVDEAQETLLSMLNCISFDDFMEDIREGMKDKSAQMRFQTLKFVEKCLEKRDKKMTNAFKSLTAPIIDMNADGSSEVRDKSLDILCKLKALYGMNFFGDKLKKLHQKKLYTIQNYVDESMEEEAQEEPVETLQARPKLETLPLKDQRQPESNSIPLRVPSKASVQSEPVSKTPMSDFQSTNESLRLNFYQNLLQKPPQTIYAELIEGFKNKVPMTRESSPSLLKAILNLVKKSATVISVEHMQLLAYHDWKKCKHMLNEFIQTNRLSLPALEYVKGMGLIATQPQANSKRAEREREQAHGQSNFGAPTLTPLKQFYSSIQGLIPKMSNPDPNVKMAAADSAVQLLSQVPIGAPTESTTEPNPSLSETISQYFNVLRCRIQDSNLEISNKYIEVVTEMLLKGFLAKYRTLGRQLMSLCIQKIPMHNMPNLDLLIEEMVRSQESLLWQYLAVELPKQEYCPTVLNIIRSHMESFFKTADQKSYILPLLTCISKQIETQRCSELLDQIIEINGEGCIEKIVRESKLTGNTLDSYLKKWNLNIQPSERGGSKGSNSTPAISAAPLASNSVQMNKLDRLNSEMQNPWPLSPPPALVLNLISNFISMGEPFSTLASPLSVSENQFCILAQLSPEFIEDFSDLLCKWILWKVHTEFIPNNVERILELANRIITTGFQLHESEMVTLLGAMLCCLSIHKSAFLNSISRINLVFNSSPVYKEKAFRFWINSFNEHNAPVDQILTLLVNSYDDLIQTELVTLARFPAVVRNKEFNDYLKANYTQKLLTVYGFKLQDSHRLSSHKNLKSQTLQDCGLQEEERKLFIEYFQRSSSYEVIEKVKEHIASIHPEMVMGTHLKIMHSIIMPYLQRELPFINVYNYFKYLQVIIVDVNFAPVLSNLVSTLAFFLVDLDEIKLENNGEMLKTINKLLLIMLETSEPRHILEVLFIMMKKQFKLQDHHKLTLLLPKCVLKVIKNPSFKMQVDRNSISQECISFVVMETLEVVSQFDIALDSSIMRTIKTILNELLVFPHAVQLYQQIQREGEKLAPNVRCILQELTQERAKENQTINEDKVFSHAKDPRANALKLGALGGMKPKQLNDQ